MARTSEKSGAVSGTDLRCPACGALDWDGSERGSVRRLRDSRIVADALPEWGPDGPWTCAYCDSIAESATLRLALDGLVQRRLGVLAVEQQQSDERLRSLNRRLRAAWLAGAEAEWTRAEGRGLDQDELAFVIDRYPGDVPITPTES